MLPADPLLFAKLPKTTYAIRTRSETFATLAVEELGENPLPPRKLIHEVIFLSYSGIDMSRSARLERDWDCAVEERMSREGLPSRQESVMMKRCEIVAWFLLVYVGEPLEYTAS